MLQVVSKSSLLRWDQLKWLQVGENQVGGRREACCMAAAAAAAADMNEFMLDCLPADEYEVNCNNQYNKYSRRE